ncbi:TPA: D-Ala-D-Ala dipeptidase VanX, partial [Enterococcus faecium]|nr:D-Ala-D-Ala dipeptidase VanX [Enterococcus faecium]
AIDLTLYRLDTGELVPMGSRFDFMDERSHHAANGISCNEAQNRRRLRSIMENSGFEAYSLEWWHYVLRDEPYPNSYFDFPVK